MGLSFCAWHAPVGCCNRLGRLMLVPCSFVSVSARGCFFWLNVGSLHLGFGRYAGFWRCFCWFVARLPSSIVRFATAGVKSVPFSSFHFLFHFVWEVLIGGVKYAVFVVVFGCQLMCDFYHSCSHRFVSLFFVVRHRLRS